MLEEKKDKGKAIRVTDNDGINNAYDDGSYFVNDYFGLHFQNEDRNQKMRFLDVLNIHCKYAELAGQATKGSMILILLNIYYRYAKLVGQPIKGIQCSNPSLITESYTSLEDGVGFM